MYKSYEIMENGGYLKKLMYKLLKIQSVARQFGCKNDSYYLKCLAEVENVTPSEYF